MAFTSSADAACAPTPTGSPSLGSASGSPTRGLGRVPALFISDVQERFRDVIAGGPALIAAVSFLIQSWIALGLPIIVSEQNPLRLGNTVSEIAAALDTAGAETLLRLEKTRFSMMTDTVDSFVKSKGVTSAVVVGLETHICVVQTARDLVALGLPTYVVVDATSSQRPFDRTVALARLPSLGVQLTTSESIVFEALGDATHPAFKAIAALNKARASLLGSASTADDTLMHM